MREGEIKFKAAVVEVIPPHSHADEVLEDLKEVELLLAPLSGKVFYKTVQHRLKPHGAYYIGPGKLEELKKVISEKRLNLLVINNFLTAAQIFRVEKQFWDLPFEVKVWDRVNLILEIFEHHASSYEAKLQVELARLKLLGPRIYGLGKELSRQAGGIGTRGIGEKNIEIMKRMIKDRIRRIEEEIEARVSIRSQQINKRKQNNLRTISLVGYTNAGKTTLFNLLTGKDKKEKNSLFTTLDSYTGRINYNGFSNSTSFLLTDTIGFIKNLPPELITAFKSTLLETVNSDLVLHLVDLSDPKVQKKIQVVDRILEDLGVEKRKIVYVFNKIDLFEQKPQVIENLKKVSSFSPRVFISAKKRRNIDELLKILKDYSSSS